MARRVPSMYVPLDANYLRDPRIREAGSDAELLYLRALAHAKAGETDGMIHRFDLPVVAVGLRSPQARVNALVRTGLWEERDDGWFIAGWFKWNDSTSDLRGKREKRIRGAQLTNHAKHQAAGTDYLGTCAVCAGECEPQSGR